MPKPGNCFAIFCRFVPRFFALASIIFFVSLSRSLIHYLFWMNYKPRKWTRSFRSVREKTSSLHIDQLVWPGEAISLQANNCESNDALFTSQYPTQVTWYCSLIQWWNQLDDLYSYWRVFLSFLVRIHFVAQRCKLTLFLLFLLFVHLRRDVSVKDVV